MKPSNTKPKTILHIINSLGLGGAEILLLNTLKALTEYDHIVVCLTNEGNNQVDLSKYAKVYKINFRFRLLFFFHVLQVRNIIKKNNVAIVHAHLWLSTLIARLATPKKIRLLFTLHSLMSKDAFGSKSHLLIEKMFYKKKQELIAVSETVQNDYSQYIHVTGKKHILYNFVENKFFTLAEEKKQSNSFRLIAVGNLKNAKNYPFLLKVLSKVKGLDFTLNIYGTGSQASLLQKIIDSEKISVRLMGTENKIESVLPNYDLFVMASSYEGYGIALAEAMASGLPVLISDIPVFREIAGDVAFYFSLEDETDFSVQLSKIHKLHQQGTLVEWGNKCRERARDVASKEFFLRKLESIYSST